MNVRFGISRILCVLALMASPVFVYAQEGGEAGGDQPKSVLDGIFDSLKEVTTEIVDEVKATDADGTALGEGVADNAEGAAALGEGAADGAEDALAAGDVLSEAVDEEEKSLMAGFIHQNLLIRLGIAVAIIIIQIILLKVVWSLFAKLNTFIGTKGKQLIKPLSIKKYRILDTSQIMVVILFLVKVLKLLVTVFQLYLTLPLLLILFEPTRSLASSLFGYVLNPIKNTAIAIVMYIPKLITIAVILVIVRYALRSIKFFTDQIAKGKLVINGFYADWAQPTFNILRVLLYAFAIIVIYPYLPGSESAVFQGVSMFVGLIFSLGSSSAIGNLVAGVVLTYMRPFKVGDRIKIGEITGFVVEKATTITRIRTHKNEFLSLPNQAILSATITNYNYAADHSDGLILHTDITMTYSVHWTTMYNILLTAARKTVYVLDKPEPYILQKPPEDNYARYELNIYVKEVAKIPAIFSDLHNHLQDEFRAAGVDLTAPFFHISTEATPQMPPVELKFPYFPVLPPKATLPNAPAKAQKPQKGARG
ncbi:MAG: mechanosensitive ion channel family protein [Treponema sp.]|jgi:small-conductance mechanosensitive channel|nr:mechanosensitive ion channel family protein [Treponema sp.]